MSVTTVPVAGVDLARRYVVEHETCYAYTAPVSQSWQLARLTPRALPWQKLLSHALQIDPPADERHDTPDSFGNTVTHFGLHGAHRVLRVRMHSVVEVSDRPRPDGDNTQPWEHVRDAVRSDPALDGLLPAQMSEPTRLVPMSEAARLYAA
ncbi:MAG TPA: transglutaminase N-terminal domain-containing protein, partial [Albitalea sp.]|nr:transglutaminase N-terminal domain-containing protein [Albitalea sp.]